MDDIATNLIGKRDALLERRKHLLACLDGVRGQIIDVDKQLVDCAAAARVFGVEWPQSDPTRCPTTVKDAVLSYLDEVGGGGATVTVMRPVIERRMATTLHPKTLGMTLFRLKTDGAVVRVGGRVWRLSKFVVCNEQPTILTPKGE